MCPTQHLTHHFLWRQSKRLTANAYLSAPRFTLAQEIDSDKAEAKYRDGVLDLTLPKKPGSKTTDVQVK